MCGFVRDGMLLADMISIALLRRGARYKEDYILQRPDLADGEVMALLASWRG